MDGSAGSSPARSDDRPPTPNPIAGRLVNPLSETESPLATPAAALDQPRSPEASSAPAAGPLDEPHSREPTHSNDASPAAKDTALAWVSVPVVDTSATDPAPVAGTATTTAAADAELEPDGDASVDTRAAVTAALSGVFVGARALAVAHRVQQGTKRQRVAACAVALLQMAAVLLPALIVSTATADRLSDYLRSVAVAGAGVLTATTLPLFLRATRVADGLELGVLVKCLSVLLEMQLFAIGSSWGTLLWFGVVDLLLSLAAVVLALWAHRIVAEHDVDATELAYTSFAGESPAETKRRTDRLLGVMEKIVDAATPGFTMSSQEDAMAAAAAAVDHRGEESDRELTERDEEAAQRHSQALSRSQPMGPVPHGAGLTAVSDNPLTPTSGAGLHRRVHRPPVAVDAFSFSIQSVSQMSLNTQRRPSALAPPSVLPSAVVGPSQPPPSSHSLSGLSPCASTTTGPSSAAWCAANRVRLALYDADRKGRFITVWFLLLMLALCGGTVVYEFVKIFANQPPLFHDALNDEYNAKDRTAGYFPARTHSRWKVHLVVLDGLRFDTTEAGASALGDFLQNATVGTGATPVAHTRLTMRAQLPSFSVPNWMTMLSGATPELTGVTGNLINGETSFDSIFRKAQEYGLHAGMTGTPWWRDLVASHLPTLDGDGTVSASFEPATGPRYPWTTSNPADEAREAVAVKAMRRAAVPSPFGAFGPERLFELFLTHFSDIDTQGHEYGVSAKYNKRNTYYAAIENKTAALRNILAATDNDTIVLVTSDHGQVAQGGHGGTSEVLLKVPLLVMARNASVAPGARPVFAPTDYPRYGAYENTDLAATVTALLGLPAPRQTTGIFIEEILTALVPPAALSRHYHDLFRARLSLLEQMAEYADPSPFVSKEARDLPKSDRMRRMAQANGTGVSDRAHGDAVRELHRAFRDIRDSLHTYVFVRNLVFALLLVPAVGFVVYVVFERRSIPHLFALTHPDAAGHRDNLMACGAAAATVVLHLAVSLAAFLIAYYGISSYDVWDPTLTHTVSAGPPYALRAIVFPVVVYIFITRLVLGWAIHWHSADTLRDIRLRRPVTHLTLLRWAANVVGDVGIVLFGTGRYRRRWFPRAYLYLYYVALWAGVGAFAMLVFCFPFSFMVPVIMASPFVSVASVEWRFRMITFMLLHAPLLAGTAVLLLRCPALAPETLCHWDGCFLQLQLLPDRAWLISLRAALHRDAVQMRTALDAGDAAASETEYALLGEDMAAVDARVSLLDHATRLLRTPGLRYLDTTVADAAFVQ